MTTIIIEGNSLIISGHTEYDEYGKDIVCSAISSLVCGAAEIWKTNKEVKITHSKEDVLIKFEINKEKEKVNIEFNFLKKLLKLIAVNYPKNIEYIEKI